MLMTVRMLLGVVCLAAVAQAQTPAAPGRTLRQMILSAWSLSDYQLEGGPGWLDTAKFKIPATLTRTSLTETFHLALHSELREISMFALVVGPDGTEIRDSDPRSPHRLAAANGKLEGRKVTMAALAQALSGIVGRSVQDETGLTGEYDVRLAWTPDQGPKTEREKADLRAAVETRSIFSAVQEQLGLKLEARKARVQFFTIDSAEKPREN